MNIIVYSKNNCLNCTSAKSLLDSKKLEFIERNIETDAEAKDMLMRTYPEARQMPQIFIDGQRVGGFAGLANALKELNI